MNLWAGKIGSQLEWEMLTINFWKEKPFLKKREENTMCSLVYHDQYIEFFISCDANDFLHFNYLLYDKLFNQSIDIFIMYKQN